MKYILHLILAFYFPYSLFAQEAGTIKMTSLHSKNEAIQDLMDFQNIDNYTVVFSDRDLANKTFSLSFKNIRGGKIFTDSIIFDSKNLVQFNHKKVNDTIFKVKIYAQTKEHKLHLYIKFPKFSTKKEFELIDDRNDYHLRNIAEDGAKI